MTQLEAGTAAPSDIAGRLLDWYDRHHRDLPWRLPPGPASAGRKSDPYHVWLSEVMLQQTTVAAVRPYFYEFLRRWPSVAALAAADVDEVMQAWAGLGYYSRARNLKKCAEEIAARHGGAFPSTEAGLAALPGIGPYTAAAIAAIAFGEPAVVVDGNVERVTTRLFAIATPLPAARPAIRGAVAALVPAARPGDFAQATMDLGATICTPNRPKCILCPVREFCAAAAGGEPERFPVKAPKAERPARRGAAFVAVSPGGAVLLRRRPPRGLLGGMAEVPTSAWSARGDGALGTDAAPFPAPWRSAGSVNHVFTHFSLELAVHVAAVERPAPEGYWWSPPERLGGEALSSLMKKVIEAALPGATRRSRHQTETT